MARGPHVHAVAMHTPQVGWCPSAESFLTEDEPTKKVPEYLIAFARSFEEDLITDTHTMPMCGVATNNLEALDELEARELTDAFESIDRLESDHPAPPSSPVPMYASGVVPLGTLLPREVIPPPPRRPQLAPAPPSTAFAASLAAFTRADMPFRAEADNEQLLARPKRHVHALTSRAAISRTIASAVIASFAVFVLFVIGGRPLVIVPPVARTGVTLHARSERSDPTARVQRSATFAAPRSAPVFVPAPRFDWRRAPVRVAKAPAGRIIRTSPF
jgi:hypothetical protein